MCEHTVPFLACTEANVDHICKCVTYCNEGTMSIMAVWVGMHRYIAYVYKHTI